MYCRFFLVIRFILSMPSKNKITILLKTLFGRLANKKTFENLVLAGGFDSFKNKRAQYFNIDSDGLTFLEKTVKYGAKYQESVNSSQISLFGEGVINDTSELTIPDCEEWINLERLKKEREVVGIYISAHPLDDYLKEINNFTSTGLSSLNDLNRIVNKDFYVGGIINEVEHLVSKTGNGFGVFSFEDGRVRLRITSSFLN